MLQIEKLLPGFNCGECGLSSCREFAAKLVDVAGLERCPMLSQERFSGRAEEIARLLALAGSEKEEEIVGVLDGLRADFALAPLSGEPSCREDLHPFNPEASLKVGDVFRYRPLGCPITHFAKVLKSDRGIVTVHLVGPLHLLHGLPAPQDIGICMVAAFEGTVSRGRRPEVGETVRFLPEHCMMQKVHSGVVVHSEGRMVRIEGIDLKVW
ncbi:MAG TPA: (Fe-S)-binding protein [Methanothrix sp.]|nr:(Fe-S)-binding protein [Methanothrix sp.]HPT19226.1 (Fe-S)-binding protein [Methanothrix sp.]